MCLLLTYGMTFTRVEVVLELGQVKQECDSVMEKEIYSFIFISGANINLWIHEKMAKCGGFLDYVTITTLMAVIRYTDRHTNRERNILTWRLSLMY